MMRVTRFLNATVAELKDVLVLPRKCRLRMFEVMFATALCDMRRMVRLSRNVAVADLIGEVD